MLKGKPNRLLVVTLAASSAAHFALIALMPGARPGDAVPHTLEVVLVRPATPLPVLEEQLRAPQPQSQPARQSPKLIQRPVREDSASKPAPAPTPVPEQKQILALPDAGPSAATGFSVPQAIAEPQSVEPKPSGAAPAAPTRETVAAVPPNLSAAYLRNAPPRYPLIARRNGVEGTVRLKVLVTRDGRAAHVQLDQTSGSSVLDNAALDAVRNWQFVPARRGQDPIESWVVVPVVFKLENPS